jgi:uncharacterized protein (DUF1778 family)
MALKEQAAAVEARIKMAQVEISQTAAMVYSHQYQVQDFIMAAAVEAAHQGQERLVARGD